MSSEEEIGEPSSLPIEMSNEGQMFAAEYRDGQLQIVEVSPYDKGAECESTSEYPHGAILPDLSSSDEQTKYLQLNEYGAGGKGLMQLNLLNFALVKSADGSSAYQLVSSGDAGGQAIACLLSDGDEDDPRESYVMLEEAEGEDPVDPCVYLQATTAEGSIQQVEAPPTEHNAHSLKTTQTHQLMRHTRDAHTDPATFVMTNEEFQSIDLDANGVMSCDVLVCGACGFESGARTEFLAHIAQEHSDISAV